MQIIALNDKIISLTRWVTGSAFVAFKRTIRDGEMVGVDMVFSFEIERWHVENTPYAKSQLSEDIVELFLKRSQTLSYLS